MFKLQQYGTQLFAFFSQTNAKKSRHWEVLKDTVYDYHEAVWFCKTPNILRIIWRVIMFQDKNDFNRLQLEPSTPFAPGKLVAAAFGLSDASPNYQLVHN